MKTKYRLPGMTEEQVVGTCPPDVPPHQWVKLVHYWFFERGHVSSNFFEASLLKNMVYYIYIYITFLIWVLFLILQTYSDIGRAARASQSVLHTLGSKSYVRVRQEFVSYLNYMLIFSILKYLCMYNDTNIIYQMLRPLKIIVFQMKN